MTDKRRSLSHPHLVPEAAALLAVSPADRIRAIQVGTWIGYARAKAILARMEELLNYPRVTRMPNMLLIAPPNNGKTSILERFLETHPAGSNPETHSTVCPVLFIEAPPTADVAAFYSRILDALMAPYKKTAKAEEKLQRIKVLFAQLGVKLLIIDEIHHLMAGAVRHQQAFRNALKSLGNETKISIVASGTHDAYNAFNTDPQMSSRFHPEELPLWGADEDFGSILDTLEERTPLAKPSELAEPAKMYAIHQRSEGSLGDLCDFFKVLSIDAIRSGAEEITLDRIHSLKWVPPSRRKQHQMLTSQRS